MSENTLRQARGACAATTLFWSSAKSSHRERFQRTLGAASDSGTTEPTPPRVPDSAAATATELAALQPAVPRPPMGNEPAPATPAPPARNSAPAALPSSARATPEVQSAAVAVARPTEPASDAAEKRPSAMPTPPPTPSADAWETALATAIGTLCISADPAFRHWTVQVPLDPAVLPETRLTVTLSPLRLQLRFVTDSAWSQHLLAERGPRLVALLSECLPGVRDIDLDIS